MALSEVARVAPAPKEVGAGRSEREHAPSPGRARLPGNPMVGGNQLSADQPLSCDAALSRGSAQSRGSVLSRASGRRPSRLPEPAADCSLKSLVDAARKGDPKATGQLVKRTWQSTFTLAFRLTGNEQDALDVTQEAYLRAVKALPRFRGEARFSTWMYRVTANCATDHMSRARRSSHATLALDGTVEDDSGEQPRDTRSEHDPEACASASDERAVLAEALLRLPWKLRYAVVLKDVYDLPHREVASRMGISEAAAKVRLQRARKRLREDLVRAHHGTQGGFSLVVSDDDDAVAS
ncbi:MAG TPA: sigma-70 family RNA polymerase sigma factor [Acidimicrobiales bacterium]|nr:sigma-70 family RNA polymerase sigma factor [Acidimicrobiales bacterium]